MPNDRVLVLADRVYPCLPGRPLDRAAVLVEAGVIRAVGPRAEVTGSAAAGADVLDLGAAVVVPGFIDAHVHLALLAAADAPAAVTGVADDVIAARMVTNARDLLAAGVTTARDLGAPLRPALAARALLTAAGGPRLLVAGAPVTGVGGHLHFFGGAVGSAEAAASLVRRQVSAGADWVKLVLSGGEITPGSHLRARELPDDTARVAVATARALGRRVAVHAHTAEAARLAADLGVETVEHCTLLDLEPGASVAPATVCPTANRRWLSAAEPARAARAARLAALRSAGSVLIAGTDAGIPGVPFGAYADGLLALGAAGLGSDEVLAAATTTAAQVLGLRERGRLVPGTLADLVALAADPLDDLNAVRHPVAVLVGGRDVSVR